MVCLKGVEWVCSYRCLQPGHVARDCKNEIVCTRCEQPGHRMRECKNDPICYKCKQVGHISSQCPNPMVCYNCGETGHKRSECPKAKSQEYHCLLWNEWWTCMKCQIGLRVLGPFVYCGRNGNRKVKFDKVPNGFWLLSLTRPDSNCYPMGSHHHWKRQSTAFSNLGTEWKEYVVSSLFWVQYVKIPLPLCIMLKHKSSFWLIASTPSYKCIMVFIL